MSDVTPVVFVVDDDISVRESLELMIRFAGWQPRLFESAQDFLDAPRALVPSCLVLDINLPDLNGLDLQTALADERHNMPIIFITGYGDIPRTVRALKAGAVEFLTKPFNDEVILSAMADALQSSRVALEGEKNLRALLEAYKTLTPREQEIMASVVSGRLNKLIAADLNISEITVKAHRGKVMRKMKARSLADLVKMAALITPE
ncbi:MULTISPECIES: response regulator transcription factor [Pseudomonas]|uniref:response regulator transcription factor n=1 Tax=Pseudomonas TaxID=286 RepID=UPI0007E39F9B|nr:MULTISPECIES: response regulator [Pseudomonas]MBP3996911.1 response regulator transcription factor [Pseudomonas koreensis]QIA03005.1 response regulator transcription factor [Pseudomonas fluorescens]TFA85763.1 LuxR family two component transcriptional regulator [Pseudomonas sp. LAIL14HWK12:I2]SCZ41361.1 two component transcriptional regulator, LuxR family [Pseudomonas sp. NFIX46]SDB51121.1 two component transcriptional regulator, LuxR family [Pseudomonas putida]